MRLLLINGNTSESVTARCAAAAREAAGPGTEIVAVTATRGPRIIGSRTENALACASMVELLAAHGGSCDAVLIAVSFDTGLDALREAAPFPVVGMTEAALHAAALLGGQIGFIGPLRRARGVYEETIARTGLSGRIAGYRVLEMRPQDYADPAELVSPVVQIAGDLIERDGAESIVVAGAALAGLIDRVQTGVAVPVIDGIAAGVVLAEAMVRLGRPKATAGSHGRLPARHITGFDESVRRLFDKD